MKIHLLCYLMICKVYNRLSKIAYKCIVSAILACIIYSPICVSSLKVLSYVVEAGINICVAISVVILPQLSITITVCEKVVYL